MEVTFMREDAVILEFLGVKVYAFGLYAALGAALAMLALIPIARKAKWKAGTGPVLGALSLALGFVFSRIFYCLMDVNLGALMPLWAAIRVNMGGYSLFGALFGVCLAAVLTGWLTGQKPAALLDYLVPAFLLFILCERLGERYIMGFGQSRTLSDTLLNGSFLTLEDPDYEGTWKLATYYIEAFAALVLALVALWDLRARRRPGSTFLQFMLLFGASQIILESLRYDQHMTVISFVRLEQVMSMALLGVALIVLAVRNRKKHRVLSLIALIAIPLTVGAGVGIEFMIDRSDISHYLLYAVFILIVGALAFMGLWLRREDRIGG